MKVTSFRELLAEQANAAVRISGAHHSSWNGRPHRTIARERTTGGVAGWDHTIEYNPRVVDEPLQDMFRNSRVHNQDRNDLRSYRKALKVVLHENVHLLASEGRDHAQARVAFGSSPGVRPIEEAITELYSQQQLDNYIDELGLDEIAPGIKNVRSNPVYEEYLPAAEAFAETIGQRSQLGSDEVIRRLAVVPADQKYKVAAEAIYDNGDLPGLMPSDQRDQAVGRIAEAMRSSFAQIENIPEDKPDRDRRVVGGRAARNGYKVVDQLRQQWTMPAPGRLRERGMQEVQQRQPPQPGRQSIPRSPVTQAQTPEPQPGTAAEVGQGRAVSGRAQVAGSQDAGTSALPPDVAAAARAGLSGSRPLTSATWLSADQQGSRRTTTPAGPERQTPTHER
jgi:hypothetical protein